MKVKFTLRNGQTITTSSFENDPEDLEDFLSGALGGSGEPSVFNIEAKDGIFLFRTTDVVSIKIQS